MLLIKKEVQVLKKIMCVFVFFLLISSANALVTLGEFNKDQCVTIKQSCGTCTFINATITYPNSSVAIANISLESIGSGSWIYEEFCNTSIKGRYDVFGVGNPNATLVPFATFFIIGKQSPTGESILYVLFILILFLLLCFLMYFIFVLPRENEKNDRGFETKIIKLKYIRALFLGISYGILIVLLNLLNGLSVNFTSFSIFAGTLGFLFESMLRLSWPFYIILVVWVVYMLIHDSNVQSNINKAIGWKLGG